MVGARKHQGGRNDTLHVSMPLELKQGPSTRSAHPGHRGIRSMTAFSDCRRRPSALKHDVSSQVLHTYYHHFLAKPGNRSAVSRSNHLALCIHKHDDAQQCPSVYTKPKLRETHVGGMTTSYDSSLAAPKLHHMQKLVWPNG